MPATISAYHTFLANTRAKASEGNRNFSNHRGTALPISEDTATASDNAHDLGSSDHRWRNGYIGTQLLFTDAATSPSAPLTGTSSLFTKDDGVYLRDLLSAERLATATEVLKPRPGWVLNIGITYAAGVLTVCAADGSALSASNPGYVALQSKGSPGELVIYTVTANQSFIDDAGASEIVGNLGGTTTGISWANDCPWFLYAVGNDAETAIAFMISRDPRASVSPAAANIGAPDDPVCDLETDFFSFDNLDETLYDDNPCLCFGAIRMQKSASDDWTVQALTTKDGVGKFHESTKFTFPQNQNGAASGTHIQANGGTPAQFTVEEYYYWVRRSGAVRVHIEYNGDAGTDGSGAVNFLVALPLTDRGAIASFESRPCFASTSSIGNVAAYFRTENTNAIAYRLFSLAGNFIHNTWANGARQLSATFEYQAFGD